MEAFIRYFFLIFIFAAVSHAEIAIYTGTFDPPTFAHLAIMRAALESEKPPVKSLYVLVNISGEKQTEASIAERIDMIRLGLGPLISQTKILTVDQADKTLAIRKISAGVSRILYYIGQDSYEKLNPDVRDAPGAEWRIIPRGSRPPVMGSNATILADLALNDISSTRVRQGLRQGMDVSALLNADVAAYIRQHGLYRPQFGVGDAKGRKRLRAEFRLFLKNVSQWDPTMDFRNLDPPPYDPYQSPAARKEGMLSWTIEKKHLFGERAVGLRQFGARYFHPSAGCSLQWGRVRPDEF